MNADMAVKAVVSAASMHEQDVRREAEARGMTLTVKWLTSRPGVGTTHWMIDAENGRRIVDYWPGTGTWRCLATGEKGKL